jgi:sec-independent protein translocase protein TatC
MAEIVNKLIGMREVHQSQEFQTLIDPDRGFLGNLFLPNPDNLLRQMSEQLNSKFDLELSRELNQILIARAIGGAIRTDRGNFVRLIVWKASRVKSQSLGAAEPFMIWMKAGLITGLIISSPWVFYWLWVFVAAGLYPTEKRNVHLFLPISLLLFFAGVLLAFFFVFEPVLDFMFGFNARMGIEPQPRINDWLSFVLFLPLGFGIAFQLPLVMLFANRIGIIALETYWDKWRIAVVVIFGISMVLTPADPVSMILMAVPLTVLYFLGILLCRWFSRPANPFEAAS